MRQMTPDPGQAGKAASHPAGRRAVWVYSGMGPQWAGMGQGLMQQAAFADGWQQACQALFLHGLDLRDLMQRPPEQVDMQRNRLAQPANFALQVALTCLLRQHGLQAAAIIGHSTGEMAASWAAGALSLDDAARVVAVLTRLQQTVAGGGMLALGMSAQALAPFCAGIDGVLDIAAYNAANSLTLSGDLAALTQLEQRLLPEKGARRIFARRLTVEVAYHSAHMDGLQDALLAQLGGLQPQAPDLPLYSSVSGAQVSTAMHDAQYWWRNARHAVQFMAAMQQIEQNRFDTYLQIGPHPVLASAIKANSGQTIRALALIDRKQDALLSLHSVLDALGGTPLD